MNLKEQLHDIADSIEVRKIEVNLDGIDEPLVLYHKGFSLKDLGNIRKRAKGNIEENLVYTLIFGALDENGEKIFDLTDKAFLMASPISEQLADIVLKMSSRESFDDRVKD